MVALEGELSLRGRIALVFIVFKALFFLMVFIAPYYITLLVLVLWFYNAWIFCVMDTWMF